MHVQKVPVTDPALFRSAAMPETSYNQCQIEASFYHTSVCVCMCVNLLRSSLIFLFRFLRVNFLQHHVIVNGMRFP